MPQGVRCVFGVGLPHCHGAGGWGLKEGDPSQAGGDSCCTPPRRPWGQPSSGARGSGLGTKWGCCGDDKCIMSWAAEVGSHC